MSNNNNNNKKWSDPRDDLKIIELENKLPNDQVLGKTNLLPVDKYNVYGRYALAKQINIITTEINNNPLSNRKQDTLIETMSTVIEDIKTKKEQYFIYAFNETGKLSLLSNTDKCVWPMDNVNISKIQESILSSTPLTK